MSKEEKATLLFGMAIVCAFLIVGILGHSSVGILPSYMALTPTPTP